MSSSRTISIGFKIEDSRDGFRKLVLDADGLSKAMKSAVVQTDKFKASWINLSAATSALDSLSGMVRDFQSVIADLTGAYNIQKEAETQLELVMRNTMNARDEDIQSIKDFCSAQQELGIVGDEVQLAGAQELATYLQLKSSLKTLIPVMNDMVAQQYGLAHTGENAAQIATMLGKVMNGQTAALSRYGYTFDDAQEKILKFGTESEKAAVLAQVVGESVGGMNAKLAQTDAGKMKQLENKLGDVKEQLGEIAHRIAPIISIGADATMAAMGVMKLVKGARQAAMAFRALGAAAGPVGLALTAISAAVAYFVLKSDEATDAAHRLADAQNVAKRAAEMAADAAEAEADARRGALSSIELNIARLKEFNGTKAEEKKLVREMNSAYGETMGYFKTVADWYTTLTANSRAYCAQMVAEARARKLADQIAELQQQRDEITRNTDGSAKLYSKQRQTATRKLTEAELRRDSPERQALIDKGLTIQGGRHVGGKWQEEVIDEVPGTSDLEVAQQAVRNIDAQIAAKTATLQAATKEAASTVMPRQGSATPPELGTEAEKSRLTEINTEITRLRESYVTATDTQRASIRKRVEALEEEKSAIELAKAELERPLKLETADDYDRELAYWAQMRKRATEEGLADIDRTVEALKLAKSIMGGDQESLTVLRLKSADLGKRIEGTSDEQTRRDLTAEKAAVDKKIKVAEKPLGLMADDEKLQAYVKDLKLDDISVKLKPDTSDMDGKLGKYFDKPATDAKRLAKNIGKVSDVASDAGRAFAGMGQAFELPALDVAGIIAGTIASILQGYAMATVEGTKLGPFGWAAFSLAGLAQVTAMVAQIKSVAKFADGGVVTGPTMALVGEYAGASNNPEVIAPLNKLKAIIGETGAPATVVVGGEVRVKGRDLAIALRNEKTITGLSGRK